MSTRKIDYIIEDARLSSENEDFSDTIGIKDSEFLRFINDAQTRIQSLIIQQHPSIFLTEKIYTVTGGQEAYTLPSDTFVGNKVSQVDFSPTQSEDNYYPLRPTSLFTRVSNSTSGQGDPSHYIRKSGQVLLQPVPSNGGSLRVTYTNKIPKLDLKRASVSAVTLSASAITSLSFDISTDTVDSTFLNKNTRFCVVDEEGTIKMRDIKFTSINTTTGAVTIDGAFTFESGETIEVGDFIVSGSYSSTHSTLDEMVERYLITYCVFQILKRESNSDVQNQFQVLSQMESEIVDAYAEITDDIMEIPEIISYDDQW